MPPMPGMGLDGQQGGAGGENEGFDDGAGPSGLGADIMGQSPLPLFSNKDLSKGIKKTGL